TERVVERLRRNAPCLDDRDGIVVIGLIARRPRHSLPNIRDGDGCKASGPQRRQCLREQRGAFDAVERQIGAQADIRARIGVHLNSRRTCFMANILDRLIHPDERVALFIDGANLYSAAKALAFDIDYRKLLDEFRKQGRFIRATYYTALLEDQDFSPIRPLVDWLDYNGYSVVTKPAKEYTDANGRRRFKGDMDVEIAVDLLEAIGVIDHAFLFSGDGDFVPAAEAVKPKGLALRVVSRTRSAPPSASDESRLPADIFFALADLMALFGRPPRERAHAGERYDDEEEDQ